MIYLILGAICFILVLSSIGKENGYTWWESIIDVLKILSVFAIGIACIIFMIMGVEQLSK